MNIEELRKLKESYKGNKYVGVGIYEDGSTELLTPSLPISEIEREASNNTYDVLDNYEKMIEEIFTYYYINDLDIDNLNINIHIDPICELDYAKKLENDYTIDDLRDYSFRTDYAVVGLSWIEDYDNILNGLHSKYSNLDDSNIGQKLIKISDDLNKINGKYNSGRKIIDLNKFINCISSLGYDFKVFGSFIDKEKDEVIINNGSEFIEALKSTYFGEYYPMISISLTKDKNKELVK